jgi:hypothetical protein
VNENNGFVSFLLGLVAAAALFLIWKKEHAALNGGGMTINVPSQQPQSSYTTGTGSICPSCENCAVDIPAVTNPILATQISPTTGGSFPSVVPSVPRAPVNTLRIGVQYVSPPRAAVSTSQTTTIPYRQRTSSITQPNVGAFTYRLGPVV